VASASLAQGQRYPVIRSAPSDFDVLLSSLPAAGPPIPSNWWTASIRSSATKMRARSRPLLDSARLASERLPNTIRDVQELVADTRHATQEVQGAVTDLRGILARATPDIESAVTNVRHVSDNLAKTSDRLDQFIADNEPGVTRFTHQSLPEFEQLLRESRQAARDFRDLSRSLKAKTHRS